MRKIMNLISNNRKKIAFVILNVLCVLFITNSNVYASNADPVDGINKLSNWFLRLVQALGVIFVIKNGYEMYSAWQQNDNSGMSSALKGLVGGLGMICLRYLLILLGVQI